MDSLTLEALVDLYLLRCAVEGKSPRTVHAYTETLRRFLRLVPLTDAEAVTPAHLYAYLGVFAALSLETRHRYFREVRCFFNWLVAAGYLETSPFRGLRNVRLPQRIVQPFSPAEIARLLTVCPSEQAIGRRDYAIVLTLLDTGIRCGELIQLQLADLDLAAGRLRILHGKGNKQRVVPFAQRCAEALRRHVPAVTPAPPTP